MKKSFKHKDLKQTELLKMKYVRSSSDSLYFLQVFLQFFCESTFRCFLKFEKGDKFFAIFSHVIYFKSWYDLSTTHLLKKYSFLLSHFSKVKRLKLKNVAVADKKYETLAVPINHVNITNDDLVYFYLVFLILFVVHGKSIKDK